MTMYWTSGGVLLPQAMVGDEETVPHLVVLTSRTSQDFQIFISCFSPSVQDHIILLIFPIHLILD